MNQLKKRAATLTGAATQSQISSLSLFYQNLSPESRAKAEKWIAQRRADISKAYRRTYDRALSGRSLKAAVKAHCLECMGWQREEVRACTSYPCSLWPYRDYQESAEKSPVEGEILPQNRQTGTRGTDDKG